MATLSEEAQPIARPAERRGKAGDVTVALAVRKSASWLMLETSGELFMMTRMRDRGSETSRFSPPLNLAAILPPRRGQSVIFHVAEVLVDFLTFRSVTRI